MEEYEIHWSITARLLAVGLRVVDLIYKILRAPYLAMHRLKARFQGSLAKELAQCQNSHHWLGVHLKLLTSRPSWTSIFLRSKTEWEFGWPAKKTRLNYLDRG